MPANTSRLALRYPIGSTDPNQYPEDMQALAGELDPIILASSSGPAASLPVASPSMAVYYETDTGIIMFTAAGGNPATWVQLWPSLNIPGLVTYNEKLISISGTGAQPLDLNLGREFKVTATGNVTLSLTNVPAGAGIVISVGILLVQDATGSRVWTFPGSVNWGSGGAPTFSTAANKRDLVTLISYDNGVTWFGFLGNAGF